MDNIKNDDYYISKIIQDLEFIVLHMNNVCIEELNDKMNNSNIPWNAIYGLRNRIVHDYGSVDLNVVYETLKNDIPELLQVINK